MRPMVLAGGLALAFTLALPPLPARAAAEGLVKSQGMAASASPGSLAAQSDSAGARPVSPLSFVRGAAAGVGWTSFHFEQDTPDSAADFSSGGFEYTVGLMLNLHRERVLATFEYRGLQVSTDTETTRRSGGGSLTDELEPEEREIGAGLAYQGRGPGGGIYRIEGGYRWLTVDFVRRDFRSNGTPYPGAPAFISDHYRLGGPAAGGSAGVPIGRWTVAGLPVRFRAEVNALSLQKADIETRGGAVDKRGGISWNGRAGLESGREGAWAIFLGWRTGGTSVDASDRAFTPGESVRTGKSTIRRNGVVLLLRLGAF